LSALLDDTPIRRTQLAALERVRERIAVTGSTPAARAARVVADELR
jgi:hypothetical protein